MQTYSEYRPTPHDCRGLGLPDRQNWLICPVSRTRDSGPLDQSNFASALKMLGGESDTVEVRRFGYWGPGWFEIIIVAPGSEAARIGEEIEASLADYPILDEDDFSRREYEDYVETWNCCGMSRYFAKYLRSEFNLSDRAYDLIDDADNDAVRAFYESLIPSGDYYYTCDNGANFGNRLVHAADRCDRAQLARFLKQLRAA
jgi:hypothetical protein